MAAAKAAFAASTARRVDDDKGGSAHAAAACECDLAFAEFLAEIFPENVRFRDSGSDRGERVLRWVDPRVLGPRWQGSFLRLRASDPLHILGTPPGVS